jgi:hypothetical protein
VRPNGVRLNTTCQMPWMKGARVPCAKPVAAQRRTPRPPWPRSISVAEREAALASRQLQAGWPHQLVCGRVDQYNRGTDHPVGAADPRRGDPHRCELSSVPCMARCIPYRCVFTTVRSAAPSRSPSIMRLGVPGFTYRRVGAVVI